METASEAIRKVNKIKITKNNFLFGWLNRGENEELRMR